MENVLTKEDVVNGDLAIKEIQEFVEKWTHEKPEEWKVEDDYPQLLKAIKKGLLIIDEDKKPIYTLAFPIESDSGNFNLNDNNFITLNKPSDL